MRAPRLSRLRTLRSIEEGDVEESSSESASTNNASPSSVVVVQQSRRLRRVAFRSSIPQAITVDSTDVEEISNSSSSDLSEESRPSEISQNGESETDYYYCSAPTTSPATVTAPKKSALAQRPPLSGRRKGMMKIQESMCYEDAFRINSRMWDDSSRKGSTDLDLQLGTPAARRAALQGRRPSVFQQMAKFHNKLGIRHYILVILLGIYATIGGVMFLQLEHGNELRTLQENKELLLLLMRNLSYEIFEIANVSLSNEEHDMAVNLISQYYSMMLQTEGKYAGSVFHKFENIDHHLTWYFNSAVFFAITVFTTVGYGTIACQTTAGKVMTVLYSIVGIPLMLVVLSDVGNVMLDWLTKGYNYSFRYIQKVKPRILQKLKEGKAKEIADDCSDDEYEERNFPLEMTIVLTAVYLLVCTGVVALFDYHDDTTPLLNYGNSFYFAFQSISTIGLGDVTPNRIQYNPLLDILFLFGLALLAVINKTVYMEMEQNFLRLVDRFESWLEQIQFGRRGTREGYTVVKKLASNIQLLALALPIFDDKEEVNIQQMLDPGETVLGRKIFRVEPVSLPRGRSRTTIETPKHVPIAGIYISDGRRLRSTTVGALYMTRRDTNGNELEASVQRSFEKDLKSTRPSLRRAKSYEEKDDSTTTASPAPSRKRASSEIC